MCVGLRENLRLFEFTHTYGALICVHITQSTHMHTYEVSEITRGGWFHACMVVRDIQNEHTNPQAQHGNHSRQPDHELWA